MKHLIASVVLCVAMTAVPGYADAAFPEKPVRMIVPFPAGGGTDAVARILNKNLIQFWGQPVVIDNRGGAQGSVGTAIGAKARPDGYTVTLVIQGPLAINPHIYSNAGYDPIRDFAAVARVTEQSQVLAANANVPVTTLKDLIEFAKSKPGVLSFGTSAATPQAVGELFKLITGTNLLHVPYKGSAPAVVALLAGEVSMVISGATSVAPHIRSGKARGIAVFGKERNEALPDVPSALEQGYAELSDIPEWFGFAVPTGTPKDIINALNAGFVTALKDPAVQKSIRALGLTPSPSSPQEFAQQIRFDYERWGKIVKAVGMKLD